MESTAHLELESTLGTGGKKLLTCGVDSLNLTSYYNLTGAVVIGAYNHAVNFRAD